MGFLIYGYSTAAIGIDEAFVRCPACEAQYWADSMVQSRYYHIYYIPIFPFDKVVNLICQNCGLKRYGLSFDAKLISNYDEIKKNFRHPFYTYTGVAFIACFVLIAVLFSVLEL